MRKSRRSSGVCLLSGSRSATQPPPVHLRCQHRTVPTSFPTNLTQHLLADPSTKHAKLCPDILSPRSRFLGSFGVPGRRYWWDQRSCSCSWMKLIARRGRSAQHTCCELPLARSWPEPRATSAHLRSWSAGVLRLNGARNMGTQGDSCRYKVRGRCSLRRVTLSWNHLK
jgi:hypothetical protein